MKYEDIYYLSPNETKFYMATENLYNFLNGKGKLVRAVATFYYILTNLLLT